MAQAWVVRSLRAEGYEQLAFDQDLVAVGWGQVGDLASRADQAQIREAVRAAYPFVERDSAWSYAEQLLLFRTAMARGDLVLLLRRSSPEVAVGWVTGEYRYRTDLHPEVRHVRSVRWSRVDFPRAVAERELVGLPPLMMVFRVDQHGVIERFRELLASDGITMADQAPIERDVSEESRPFVDLQRNLNYARSLATAGQHLAQLKVGAFEVRDVYRAAWVQSVAALDHWVRQEIRTRMLRLARQPGGKKPKGFSSFEIPLGQIDEILESRTSLAKVLDQHLQRARGHFAYQNPAKIRQALKLVSDVENLWGRVATVIAERFAEGSVTGTDVEARLAAVAWRRNQIAHAYDEDPDHPPAKRPINAADVTQTIDFIEQVAAAILVVLDDS